MISTKQITHIIRSICIRFDISFKDDNELQYLKIEFILLALFIFNLVISGKDDNLQEYHTYH